MADALRFAYDQTADVLDISVGRPKRAISREVQDDIFVRLDPKTHKVIGFSIINFTAWLKDTNAAQPLPVTGSFALSHA